MTRANLVRQLGDEGVGLEVGALSFSIRTDSSSIADQISLLYADYPILENGEFRDFSVSIRPVRSGWTLRKQFVEFRNNGVRPFHPMPSAHAFPLLEWGMNWCVATTMHCWIIIHAAVLERKGQAIILPGLPGAGKSTLCAVLAGRGWRLLSDEHAILDPELTSLIPAPRPISLKNESINIIRSIFPDAIISPPVEDTHKGTIAHLKPSTDSVMRANHNADPHWIVFPHFERDIPTELSVADKGSALVSLAENAFNYSLHGAQGFKLLGDMVETCDVYRLDYGSVMEAADLIDGLAE
jgi:hypothetical protein